MGDVKVGDNVNIGENVAIAKSPYENDSPNTIIGFTCGAFDLLHAGHALMLEEARSKCDYLIVGVQSDPTLDRPEKNQPVQSYDERITMVRSIRYVDEVVLYDTENDLIDVLQKLMPDVRIVGADWEGKEFTGSDLPIDVYFNSRDHGWSTSDLRRRVYNAEKSNVSRGSIS
mgnify:CR=1 FL=1|tara:strand:- start:4344 stop:4859 length:516 start_codon:yes stop_codon:yes gene_type:complete